MGRHKTQASTNAVDSLFPEKYRKSSKHIVVEEVKRPKYSRTKHYNLRSSPVQRLVREEVVAPGGTRVKRKVSTAGIFKKRETKKHAADDKTHRFHKSRSRRSPTPDLKQEPSLTRDFKDGINLAKNAIDTNLTNDFTITFNTFIKDLETSKIADKAFLANMVQIIADLSASLADEQLETTQVRDGERFKQIVTIGKRVSQYKNSVQNDELKLEDNWKQWDNLQDEFVKLGVEVFGSGAFGSEQASPLDMQDGYKKEAELSEKQHDAEMQGIWEEFEDIAAKLEQKMQNEERETYNAAKREQARLLQSVFDDM